MKPYDPGNYTPTDQELEMIPDNVQWNYGAEGAPTLELERMERERRALWRRIDRELAK